MLGKVIKSLVVGAVVLFVGCTSTEKKEVDYKEFSKVSVMISGAEGSGSGVILKSRIDGSLILTNKHICEVIQNGGYVVKDNKRHRIFAYKKYPYHDLCLITVRRHLGVNTKIADSEPAMFENAYVSGHPASLPTVVSSGHFSGERQISMIVDVKQCDENTPPEYVMYCIFFGGIPIVETFETMVVSAISQPGSSGSPVLNVDKEVSGMVFAGKGKSLSYPFIVPHSYITHFLKVQHQLRWVRINNRYAIKVDKQVNSIQSMERKCLKDEFKNMFEFCRNLAFTPIGEAH